MIARRRMWRRFLDRPVPAATLERVLERAASAPSAGNSQGWDWLVLTGAEETGRFWELDADPGWRAAPDHPGLLRAPVVLLPLADPGAYERRYAEPDKRGRGGPSSWQVPYWLIDTAFATMVLLLAATDEGLGTAFFALHGPASRTLAAFGVPDDRIALGAVALGWPERPSPVGSSARRARRALGEQVHRGRWGGTGAPQNCSGG